jgi:uncharacterized protein (TIGR02453 family)
MAQTEYFSPEIFKFLLDLERNNRREWFQKNKARYESAMKEPALAFIGDFAPHLQKISPHFEAIPKVVGGSLFRIYRDTRFAKDKTPYKTHCGIHFRHAAGKDAYTPGFYLHIDLNNPFVGVGLWHPDGPTLKKIRDHLAGDPKAWKRATTSKRFLSSYTVTGESLKRPPRGYDPDHPYIEDLKRKDFTAIAPLTQKQILAPDFMKTFAGICKDGSSLVKFICEAIGAPF